MADSLGNCNYWGNFICRVDSPHITYLFLKKRTGCFYIVSGLVGAIIILVADMLARSLVFGAELPLSVLTILFSSPMLLFWMYRQRGSIK